MRAGARKIYSRWSMPGMNRILQSRVSQNHVSLNCTCQNRACQLQSRGCGGDNRSVAKDSKRYDNGPDAQTAAHGPFAPGAMVIVTLGNPRDKFWGMILSLAPEGLGMSGIELASFEDLVLMVKGGESFSPAVVFFPMHRIERIELDLPDGNLPSLSQRFSAKTGVHPTETLGSSLANGTADSDFLPRKEGA
jgi:hypothetical protein